jgi:hypothetical protein
MVEKKYNLFFHYISIVILYIFFLSLFSVLMFFHICFCPIYFLFFFLLSLSIYINQFQIKDKRERDSIRCFSIKNYIVVIFFFIYFFSITVLFNFFVFISQ